MYDRTLAVIAASGTYLNLKARSSLSCIPMVVHDNQLKPSIGRKLPILFQSQHDVHQNSFPIAREAVSAQR
jgi:hypothetical protein